MSASAFTSKVRSQALGRTFKVQNNNSTVTTNPVFTGAAGCNKLRYGKIYYKDSQCCELPIQILIYSGGTPFFTGPNTLILDLKKFLSAFGNWNYLLKKN